jgi:hypothetical protein
MATTKQDIIIIGKGAMNSNASSAQIFASKSAVSFWDTAITYNIETCVEYSGNIWRSLTNSNIANNPASSPTQWELILKNTKDGDACFVINGASSDLMMRVNSIWETLGNKPYIISLNDNQVSPTSAFTYLGTAFPYAQIELRIRRNNSYSSAFKKTYEVLNDGTTDLQFSADGVSIGADTGVVITPSITAGTVSFDYTSTNLSQAISLEYTLRGF